VTPAPRVRDPRAACGEKEIAITLPNWRRAGPPSAFLYHNATVDEANRRRD
jgi:hypothetical protein